MRGVTLAMVIALAGPVAAQTDGSALEMLDSLVDDCTPLGAQVQVCDARDLGWINYARVEVGLAVAIGDTTAVMSAGTADRVTPEMSEAQRRDEQARLLRDFTPSFIEGHGVAPSEVEVGHVLAVPVGREGGGDRPAQLETLIIGDTGEEVTHGITVFLNSTHLVYIISSNPGPAPSEDHLFAVEELMRAVELPQ